MNFQQACWIRYVVLSLLVVSAVNAQSCPTVKLPNGRVSLRSSGRLVEYKCKRNFELVGVKFAVCISSGQWSQQIPTCVGTTCKRPVLQPNQIVEELYNGGVLKYSCTAGLTRSGPETLMCDGEKWSDKPPTCKEITTMGCDFEQEDLCGWSQDTTDDFDWLWNKGETPTIMTGPSNDHTTNSSEGHYLFMESSSPQKSGQKTRIMSPPYQPEKTKDMCLEFYYHMLGPDGANEVGDLDVYVRPQSLKMARISGAKNIFHLGGNQGDQWQRADIPLPPLDEPFNIVFQATRLNSWTGDIAIDDVMVINCLEKIPTTKTPVEKYVNDGLDNGVTESSTPRRSPRRLPTTLKTPASTRKRKQKSSTTPTLAPAAKTKSSTPKVMPTSFTTGRKLPKTSTPKVMPTSFTTGRKLPKTSTKTTSNIIIEKVVSDNIKSSTPSFVPSGDNTISSDQRTTSINQMGSYFSSTITNFKTTNLIENTFNPKGSNRYEDEANPDNKDDGYENNNNVDDKSDDSKQVAPNSDYIDYTDIVGRNKSASTNETQTPFVDFDYNKADGSGATPNPAVVSDDDDGLLPNVGPVKGDEGTPSMTLSFLPLIIGIVASVLVGVTVVAVLAWIWTRSQRKKQEKSPEDQMNIITEYVETNLNH